eukprot:8560126-Pyramimonas_sp.AAC.2
MQASISNNKPILVLNERVVFRTTSLVMQASLPNKPLIVLNIRVLLTTTSPRSAPTLGFRACEP